MTSVDDREQPVTSAVRLDDGWHLRITVDGNPVSVSPESYDDEAAALAAGLRHA